MSEAFINRMQLTATMQQLDAQAKDTMVAMAEAGREAFDTARTMGIQQLPRDPTPDLLKAIRRWNRAMQAIGDRMKEVCLRVELMEREQ